MTILVVVDSTALSVSTAQIEFLTRLLILSLLFQIASQSTAATRIDQGSNEQTLNEDVFRMIEHGNSQALKNLLNKSSIQLNRSTSGDTSNTASEVKSSQIRMSCMRMDRHFSALVFACYTNQLECL